MDAGSTTHHLAQLNVGRPVAPLDDPVMADFMAGLEPLNALADGTPGFVWRLTGDGEPDATGLRPFGPDIMVNMSVWTTVEALRGYVYRTAHLDSVRRRHEWFTHDGLDPYLVLWWIPAGTIPTLADAWERLDLLRRNGPGPDAFTLRQPYPAPV
ncbi:MAG TPA: DUF3291 domain-containing protein [Micromonosporaceae bacterium]|nr:DUF3291 domain-containing protein [Micromonosporaceae bacterium]